MVQLDRLNLILHNSQACLLYDPISDEVDPSSLPLSFPTMIVKTPKDWSEKPLEFKDKINAILKLRGFIIAPGIKFDIHGGRIGRGRGWYDRLLAIIPSDWVRIGVCKIENFSNNKLSLMPWDEKMDWVIVVDDKEIKCYETYARDIKNSSYNTIP